MELSQNLGVIVGSLSNVFFSFSSIFNLPSLAVAFCMAIGFLASRRVRRRGRVSLSVIRRAVFRKRFIRDRSVHADIGFFLLNTFATGALIGWGIIGTRAVSEAIAGGLALALGPRPPVDWPDFATRAGATLLLFIAYEFGYWVDHYLKHRVPLLWETHKPHHSAEVLTPWTVWRVHPLDTLVFTNIVSLSVGAAAGLSRYGLGQDARAFSVDGLNIILLFFIYAYVHLQHSQFWIPFTGPLGRIFLSPAHHQIHHSIDPRHHDKNFGSCLSIFDWLFGTLELPSAESPRLKFGVDQGGAEPHSITTLLITPLQASLALIAAMAANGRRAAVAALRSAGGIEIRQTARGPAAALGRPRQRD